MTQTLTKTIAGQIIGGIFSNREYTAKAIKAFQDMYIDEQNIQVIQLDNGQSKDPYTNFLVGRGFARSQARYYDKALRTGMILVAVDDVTNPTPILDVFHQFGARYRLLPQKCQQTATQSNL